MLQIHNTFTKQKELFKPLIEGRSENVCLRMTVYDYCHIGHARTVLAFDVIVRYFNARGYEVNYVRNITDIDDKIIKRADENNETVEALLHVLLRLCTKIYMLRCITPNQEPRATQYIPQMIAMIKNLINNRLCLCSEKW